MPQTPLAKLIARSLDRDLHEVVVEARNAGKDWRQIARELTEASGVRVSRETVRSWGLGMTGAPAKRHRSRPGRRARWLDHAANVGITGCLAVAAMPALGLIGYALWAALTSIGALAGLR
jgi:hypothetical protein